MAIKIGVVLLSFLVFYLFYAGLITGALLSKIPLVVWIIAILIVVLNLTGGRKK